MIRRPPRSKRTCTSFPYPTRCRAALCDPTRRVLSESTDMMVNLQVLESGGTRIIAALRPERLKMITRMLGDLLPPHRFAGPLALVAALEDNPRARSEEHTSELQSLMRISYAVFCLTKKKPLK